MVVLPDKRAKRPALVQVMQEKTAQRLLAQTLHQQMLEELRNNPQACLYARAHTTLPELLFMNPHTAFPHWAWPCQTGPELILPARRGS